MPDRTISTSASNNYKVVPVSFEVCERSGDTFDVVGGYLECRWVAGKKLKWIQINTIKQTFVNKISPEGVDVCKLQNSDRKVILTGRDAGAGVVGFPHINSDKNGVYPKGVNEVLIVGVDFPELRGGNGLKDIMAEDKKWMVDWYRYFSNDQSKFNVTTIDYWINAPKSAASYVVTGIDFTGPNANQLLAGVAQAFIELITKEIDLRKFSTVYMRFPKGEITFDLDLIVRNVNFNIKEGEKRLNFFGWNLMLELMEQDGGSFYVHETLHDFNIIGHAPGNGWPFGVFTAQNGISMAINPYEQFLLDWLPENQIYCQDAKTLTNVTLSLSPLEREDRQTKMAIIKLSSTRAIVVETHGIDKWSSFNIGDRAFPPGFYSVMAYVVDLDKAGAPPVSTDGTSLSTEEYAWAIWQKVEGGPSTVFGSAICCNAEGMRPHMFDMVAVLGDSFVVEGIRIKFIATGDYETIEISKV